jgi:hypothetical protein
MVLSRSAVAARQDGGLATVEVRVEQGNVIVDQPDNAHLRAAVRPPCGVFMVNNKSPGINSLQPSGILETAQFVFTEPKVVPHFMQQRGADLATHVRLASRYGFDVSLV